jgi:hypothetical protein
MYWQLTGLIHLNFVSVFGNARKFDPCCKLGLPVLDDRTRNKKKILLLTTGGFVF